MVPVSLVGIGGSLLDNLYIVPDFPEENTKIQAEELKSQCGGPVATALVAAAKLGMSCAYLGSIGDDQAGQEMLADFKNYDVMQKGIIVRSNAYSASSMIIVNKTSNSRTVIWSKGTVDPIRSNELDMELLKQASILHLDGLHYEAALFAAKYFRENNKIVSLDGGSIHNGIFEILPYCDWLICSEEFVMRLTEESDAHAGLCKMFKRYCPQIVVATQGESGGIWTVDGINIERYAPYFVPVVDTTGAGDVFHGALIYARKQGLEWDKSLSFASAVAGLKCRELGGRTGIPSLEETLTFINSYEAIL